MNAEAVDAALNTDDPTGAAGNAGKNAVPISAKGRRTRRRLLDAAHTVFERDGFLDARIADIATEAGVSHGTFYTYFDSKTEIFRTVITEVMTLVYDTRMSAGDSEGLTPRQRIERGNRQWVKVVHEHCAMLRLHEQVGTFDDEILALRLRVRRQSSERIRKSIDLWQEQGFVRSDLDAACMADALVSMVSNFTYFWLMLGQGGYDDETAIHTLTEMYVSALQLQE